MTAFIGNGFFHGAGRIEQARAYAEVHRAMEAFSDQEQASLLYQTWQAFSATMGCPALQPQAF
jgi:hypothetical protein